MTYKYTAEEKRFTCPLTQQIFKDPVLTTDGYYYERSAIEEYIKTNDISPMTGIKYNDKILMKCNDFDTELKKYLATANQRELNYKIDCSNELFRCINEEKFEEICSINFKEEDIISIRNQNIIKIIFSSYISVVKHLVYHNINILSHTENNYNAHHILYYGSDDIIYWYLNYLTGNTEDNVNTEIQKELNLINNYGQLPFHSYCSRSDISSNIFKYICQTYLNIFETPLVKMYDNYRFNPLHLTCKYCTDENILIQIIEYWLNELNYELEYYETIQLKWEQNIIDLIYKNNHMTQLIKDFILEIYKQRKYGLYEYTELRINSKVITRTIKNDI